MRQRGGSGQPIKGRRANRPKARAIAAPSVADLQKQVSILSRELEEARERQTATAEVLKVIASSPSDVQPVFDAIATSAKRLLGGFSSTVFRFIDGIAHLKAFTPTTPEADEILQSTFPRPVADIAAFRMTQSGEVMQIPDTEDPTYELTEIARARGYRSMLFAPLMNKRESIGFVAVTRVHLGTFVDHDVQLLKTFSDQAVMAIENARLFNETREALERQTATSEILRIISQSPTDVQPVFDAINLTAVRLLGCDLGFVLRCDGNTYSPVAAANRDGPLAELGPANLPIDPAANFPSRAILSKKMLHLPDWSKIDLPEHERNIRDLFGVNSSLFLPLLRGEECIGLLALAGSHLGNIAESELALAESFRDQALIAIENTRLFNEVQARTKELSKSLDDLRTAQDRLIQTEKLASLGQLTAGIAHEIKNPLNFVNNFAALSAELTDELNETLKSATLGDKIRSEVDELTGLLKDNLQKVVQHGQRADSIVKNMLLHSREGSGEHRPVEINAIIDESLNLAYHGARAEKQGFNITLERDFDPAVGVADIYPRSPGRF